MIILMKVLSFLIVLSIVVLVHEFGHFITAKLSGIKVEVFSFGFWKRLFGIKIGDTDYRVSLIPLGGYVKLAGEEEGESQGKEYEFTSKPRWVRGLVLFNGPFFNFLLAVFVFVFLYMAGVNVPKYLTEPAYIGFVEKGSPAEKAGLRAGDLVVEINGKKVNDWEEFQTIIATSPRETLKLKVKRGEKFLYINLSPKEVGAYKIGSAGIYYRIEPIIGMVLSGFPAEKAGLKPKDVILEVNGKKIKSYYELRDIFLNSKGKRLTLKVKRGEKILYFDITPVDNGGRGFVGISPYIPVISKKYGFFKAVKMGVGRVIELTKLTFGVLKKLITGKLSPKTVSGPIDIADFSYYAVKSGAGGFWEFIAFLSLQLGLINLLPVPALDGGHLLVLLIEGVIRRDLSPKMKDLIANIGFALLIILSVFIVFNDILKRIVK